MGLTVFRCTSGSHQLVAAHKTAMRSFANLQPEIGNCRRSNHARQYSGGSLSSQPPPCPGRRPMSPPRSRLLIAQR
jgi:hypothetical protein